MKPFTVDLETMKPFTVDLETMEVQADEFDPYALVSWAVATTARLEGVQGPLFSVSECRHMDDVYGPTYFEVRMQLMVGARVTTFADNTAEDLTRKAAEAVRRLIAGRGEFVGGGTTVPPSATPPIVYLPSPPFPAFTVSSLKDLEFLPSTGVIPAGPPVEVIAPTFTIRFDDSETDEELKDRIMLGLSGGGPMEGE